MKAVKDRSGMNVTPQMPAALIEATEWEQGPEVPSQSLEPTIVMIILTKRRTMGYRKVHRQRRQLLEISFMVST